MSSDFKSASSSSSAMAEKALPYHEPAITTILTQSSFLLLLNLTGYGLDKLIFCGLVGQIFIGVAWGTPGAGWLLTTFQEAVSQLGYLGLILVVFEGGLSTSIHTLRSNLALSVAVALTGICLPIGLSFSLLSLSNSTPLQAFAAGSALCSTSLGTTFTVLKTSGLATSRLGVVLTSAAMLDDVVGLIMVQIISNLGPGKSSFTAVTVVRPIGVSFAFATMVPLICTFFIKPVAGLIDQSSNMQRSVLYKSIKRQEGRVLVHTFVLLAFVTAASYAGTSNLFASYLAGATISWYDTTNEVQKPAYAPEASDCLQVTCLSDDPSEDAVSEGNAASNAQLPLISVEKTNTTVPLGLASDIENEDDGIMVVSPNTLVDCKEKRSVSEKGLKQSEELISDTAQHHPVQSISSSKVDSEKRRSGREIYDGIYAAPVNLILMPFFFASIGFSIPVSQMFTISVLWRGVVYSVLMFLGKLFCGLWLLRLSEKHPESTGPDGKKLRWRLGFLRKPKSLYPASLLGFAMIARGEIGFLVSAIAESNGIFVSSRVNRSAETSEMFLIVTWAILLCTIVGPVAVGLLTKRVKRLQKMERGKKDGTKDPLGMWGIL